ncbi:hypothetical protein PCANC_00869 [Puccinia coronata f. sp. avenae]|uniref:Uncharacterized protein n=1 Tax=Puccinia coronata f. sp. avenae TaxID=200324 RepID=A0A2N5SVY7_9BASI|nr:hypothetical protein PCANC_14643 [Puccinia coronata f. sp. avenae]PLW58253.1 hypothetical protein PCANC_00869 [Puccinia coronata f. sp. avenae]
MNPSSRFRRSKSKFGRLKDRHVKRTARSSDGSDDSPETNQLRNCLNTNGSGPACVNAANSLEPPSSASPSALNINPASSMGPPSSAPLAPVPNNAPNNATIKDDSVVASPAPNNVTNKNSPASASPAANTTRIASPLPTTISSKSQRLGWKIGLVVPLLVILLIIGLAIRHNLVKRRKMRQTRQEMSIPHRVDGEKDQPAEREKQNNSHGSQPNGDVQDNLQAQEILKSPVNAKPYSSQREVIGVETDHRQTSTTLADESDPRCRKTKKGTRFSLRSFALRPSMDMSVFQARTDPPLDTFQLEMKNRERLSQSNMPRLLPLRPAK